MEGVLKSWAVPKGPSMNPEDKRLAVMVEDHPYKYKDFEGTIPKGNYGAGTVEIWDKGYYTSIFLSEKRKQEKELLREIEKGDLKIILHGKKLKGEFALVKMKNMEKNSWLLIKHKDGKERNNIMEEGKKNTSAEHNMEGKLDETSHKKLTSFIKPMLAKETDKAFDDNDWIFEIKWDGYRAISEVNGRKLSIYSRNGNDFSTAYPLVTQELKKININATLDGEIVVLNSKGMPDFQLLQYYKTDSSHPIKYYVFDLLFLNNTNTCDLTLLERKKLLKRLFPKNEIVKYADHVKEKGKDLFEEIKKKDMEGIMAKKATSLYYPGKRTSEWLKIKQHKTLDALIAGFTEPQGSRKHFGALILAIKEGNSFNYIGHTGTGFDEKKLDEIIGLLKPLIRKTSPFDKHIDTNMPVTWVEPKLVCEVKFSEQTKGGSLRHPVFLHLRPDKHNNEVTMETIEKPKKVKTKLAKQENNESYTFGRIKVQVTHPSKLFWPKEGITKGDLIAYYQEVGDTILPYLKDRPQSLKRNPNGILDKGFFHKDAGGDAPEWVETSKIFSESANKEIDYILCNNKPTLCYLNNLGCIELNSWHSTIKALDKPDYLVIDIDPSEKNTFDQVIDAAHAIHEIFEKIKAPNFAKTSGATGIHIYVPTQRKYTYDQLKDFSQLVCIHANEMMPGLTSLDRNLQKRGNKHIYLDYLQYRMGQTIVAPYSVRPVPGATVSAPLDWKEVKKGLSPDNFNIKTMPARLHKKGDLFSGVLGKGINLLQCLKLLS